MNATAEKQVVVFQVGNDKFALDILSIKEIARYHPKLESGFESFVIEFVDRLVEHG